ncbi:MAG: polysaccharide deacetylase family protein [Gaiellales bacterium]
MRFERLAMVSGAAIVGLALPLLLAATASDPPAPIGIVVSGHTRYVSAGTTLGRLAAADHLHPRAGNLVSVTGQVLRAGRYPGSVEIAGRAAQPARVLAAGDRVSVVNGADHTEPVRTTLVRSPTGEPPSPEYELGRAPGMIVRVVGRISGEVASTGFRPTGPVRRPKAVALTFDDGPWPASTSAILRILHRKHVRATFFLIGEQVRARASLVRSELAAGMEVGDHSWDHPLVPPLSHLSRARIHDEISFTATVEAAEGAHPTLFRPPGGSWSDEVVKLAREQGMRVVLWSVDPRDWAPGATARGITKNVLSHVHAGSIVLLHDGGGDRSATVRALPRIIDGIRRRGLKLVTVEP